MARAFAVPSCHPCDNPTILMPIKHADANLTMNNTLKHSSKRNARNAQRQRRHRKFPLYCTLTIHMVFTIHPCFILRLSREPTLLSGLSCLLISATDFPPTLSPACRKKGGPCYGSASASGALIEGCGSSRFDLLETGSNAVLLTWSARSRCRRCCE
jgi:hypothetical protein